MFLIRFSCVTVCFCFLFFFWFFRSYIVLPPKPCRVCRDGENVFKNECYFLRCYYCWTLLPVVHTPPKIIMFFRLQRDCCFEHVFCIYNGEKPSWPWPSHRVESLRSIRHILFRDSGVLYWTRIENLSIVTAGLPDR